MTKPLSLTLLVLGVLLAGCFYPRIYLNDRRIAMEIRDLVYFYPEHFANPLTLVVLVDHTPCGKALTETIWWRQWQTAAYNAGCGFVFATSRADSADVAIAARLDSVEAPVLVMPSCPDSLQILGIPLGCLPLKVLVDNEGTWHYWHLPIIDSAASAQLIHSIDSLGHASSRSLKSLIDVSSDNSCL